MVDLATQGVETEHEAPDYAMPLDGRSLAHLITTGDTSQLSDLALAEYLGEGVIEPELMIKRGSFKFIYAPSDPPLLYNLEDDPHELTNLAADPAHQQQVADFTAEIATHWNVPQLRADIVADQKRRHLIASAMNKGVRSDKWDFVPAPGTGKNYINMDAPISTIQNSPKCGPNRKPSGSPRSCTFCPVCCQCHYSHPLQYLSILHNATGSKLDKLDHI